MPKPVVLVAEELSPAGIALLEEDFEVRHVNGADRSQLLPALAGVDALIVRSATKVDAEVLAAAPSLKVVARAGVGLDNVDVEAATKAGVLVVNAPTSNIISAAEQAINLLLATARNTAAAHAALVRGEWKRSKYTGVELYDKTVGIVGLGRIGVLVAQRLQAFGTKLIAYDPFVQPARAAQLGVELVELDELLERSDFITIHLPKTKDTIGLIGEEALRKVKPTVRIINAARGGIVDETALYHALKEGRVAGAGLDVFAKEPCTDSPLFELENVVVAPHLGASTTRRRRRPGPRSPGPSSLRSPASSCRTRSTSRAGRGRGHQAGAAADGEARPYPRRARRRCDHPGRGGGPGRDRRPRRQGDRAGRAQGPLHGHRGRGCDLRERASGSQGARYRGEPDHRGESPDWRNVITVRAILSDGRVSRSRAR